MATTTVSISLQNVNSGTTINGQVSLSSTPTGNNFTSLVQTTSTSAAVVQVGGLTTYGGYFMLKNLSSTTGENINIYQDGATGTVLIGTLLPGDAFCFKPSAAVGCKSATGTPDLQVIAFEP